MSLNFNQIMHTRNILKNPVSRQDWPHLQKIIQHLENYMNKCIKERQYIEAQTAKTKIQELKKQFKKRSLFDVENRLNQTLQEIDQKHSQQIQQFEEEWQKKENKIILEFQQLINKKRQKQNEERQRYLVQLQSALAENPSPDAELHKLRWQQDQYVKQGNFLEAQKIKQKVESREEYIFQRHQKMRQNNINLMMTQLQDRHRNETCLLENRKKEKLKQLQNQYKKKRKDLQLRQGKQIREIKWIFNQEMKKHS